MIRLSFEQKQDIGLKYVRDRLEPVCPYGVRRLKSEGFYEPEQQEALERELDNVELLSAALTKEKILADSLRHELGFLKDLSLTLVRLEDQTLSEVELFELTVFCLRMKKIAEQAAQLSAYDKLEGIRFAPSDDMLAVLDPSGEGRLSFYIEDGRSEELLKARTVKRELERQLRGAGAEERESLLAARDEAARKEEKALDAIYRGISEALRPHLKKLRQNADSAGRLDACLAKAKLALQNACVRPAVGGEELILTEAVHPEVAQSLQERGRTFTPISVGLPRGVTVLTGANMGGKSVALKTVVLNTLLALSGCFVFCRKAQVPMFSRIELINRDFSDAGRGLSSFGGEILRFNEAAERFKEGGLSLIIMDEFARGTNAREGAQIAKGAVRYLAAQPAVTLFATHYDGAAEAAVRHYQVKGLQRLSEEAEPARGTDGLRRIENAMDYGLISVEPGTECPRDAIAICRLLGLPEEVLDEPERGTPEQ